MAITIKAKVNKFLEVKQTLQDMNSFSKDEVNSVRYKIYCELEDKNSFIMLGEWKTRESLSQYIFSNKFSVLLGTKALLSEPLDIQIFTVSSSEGMDTVHSIREPKSKPTPLDANR